MLSVAGLTVLTVALLVSLPDLAWAQAETDCPEGWLDGRSVGLGCLLADITTADMNQTEAFAVCQSYGEGGRLIEITSMEQISFLQSFLTEVEEEWGESDYGPGFIWWWLGLNDLQTEGEFVWPVAGHATVTFWDVEYEEPLPDPDHLRNCAMMKSAMFNLQWGTYFCDDGFGFFTVCQLP